MAEETNTTIEATRALIARVGSLPAAPASNPLDTKSNNGNKIGQGSTSLVLRDEGTNRIVGYYDPPTLTEEYEYPQLIDVSHRTGIPLVKGKPFWERLPNENIDLYDMFSHFRDQPLPRNLYLTAEHHNVEPEVVDVVSQLWAWAERAETFDEFAQELAKRERAQRIVVMEDKHSKASKRLFQKAQEILDSFTEADYTPGQALALMKQAVELERLAHHLPADEPMEIHELKAQKGNSPDIKLSGEGQKVQINFTKDWNPG